MARTTKEIFDSMVQEGISLATAQSNANMLAMFNNTSKVAVWRLLLYIKAFAVMCLEKLLDAHMVKVDSKIQTLKPGSASWVREKVKGFLYGIPLKTDSDVFDTTGYTDSQIAAAQIVKYAAVTEATVDDIRVLLVKVATLSGSDLVPLGNAEFTALQAYIAVFKYAGVKIVVYNQVADLLRAEVNVFYNPLLIDSNGLRTDAAGYPIKDAAVAYPLELEFDGEFINAGFIDAIQQAYGISRRKVNLVKLERTIDGVTWNSVGSSFVPEAGYCKFDTNGLTINYLPDA